MLTRLRATQGRIFHCWSSLAETVIHSELGASAALFVAGHNIDCLMLRYQGVNWRSKEALDCNAGLNPIQNNFNDGINVDPLEVMFIKVSPHCTDPAAGSVLGQPGCWRSQSQQKRLWHSGQVQHACCKLDACQPCCEVRRVECA